MNNVYKLQIERNTLYAFYKIKKDNASISFIDDKLYINDELFEFIVDNIYLKELCTVENIKFEDDNKKRILKNEF